MTIILNNRAYNYPHAIFNNRHMRYYNLCPSTIGRRVNDLEPLLKQHVPECYIKLQDIIRDVARRCAKDKKHPVLTAEQIKYVCD